MQFNYYFLKGLTKELGSILVGRKVTSVFSQNKDELILCFGHKEEDFFLKANLSSEASLLSFPEKFARARKNSIDLFQELQGLKVNSIRQFQNERSFSIKFEGHYELLFKLHGRHANVLLYKDNELLTLFKNNIEKDRILKLDNLDREIDQSDAAIIKAEFDLFKIFPTFDKNIKNYLKSKQFYDLKDEPVKVKILHDLLDQLNQPVFYVTEQTPKLFLFKPEPPYRTFDNAVTASNQLTRLFFTTHGFSQLKAKQLAQVRKEIKKSDSYLKQTTTKLSEIQNRRGYDEIANILMANLHLKLNPMSKEIELFDFYTNEQTKIKLKPNQSLQQNAENLYRKAKNQVKEVRMLQQNIKAKENILTSLKARETSLVSISDMKSLNALIKPALKVKKEKVESPFIEFFIEGYQVLVGKNAKNNDLLTQKYAKKDDLWLHARDVSGSHVIIRNPKGVSIAMHVIEKVAQVAAWNSKRKSDTLCPVIYTPKKFVRKPKGSLPGQVLLSKEQVVLVEPKRTID